MLAANLVTERAGSSIGVDRFKRRHHVEKANLLGRSGNLESAAPTTRSFENSAADQIPEYGGQVLSRNAGGFSDSRPGDRTGVRVLGQEDHRPKGVFTRERNHHQRTIRPSNHKYIVIWFAVKGFFEDFFANCFAFIGPCPRLFAYKARSEPNQTAFARAASPPGHPRFF